MLCLSPSVPGPLPQAWVIRNLINVVDGMGTGQYRQIPSLVRGHSKGTRLSPTAWPLLTFKHQPHSFEREDVTIY